MLDWTFYSLAHEDLQLTPTYPQLDPHVTAAGAPSSGQACRSKCHVNIGKLLPDQLRSAESTAVLAQHSNRIDKYCSVMAMPKTEPGLVSLHCIPKAQGTVKRCTECAPVYKSSWEHRIHADATRALSAYPSMQHFHPTCSPCCHAQPGQAPCICIVPNQTRLPPAAGACCRHTRGALWEPALVFHDQRQGPGPNLSL